MANAGKKVKVHYTGTLDDGTVFDSSKEREPLAFECMAGQMIKGFDAAVNEMEVGEVRTVHLEPAEAYGEHDERLVMEYPMEQVPAEMRGISAGEKIMLQGPGGMPAMATVVKISPKVMTLDLNHELAGKALNFEIELLEVLD